MQTHIKTAENIQRCIEDRKVCVRDTVKEQARRRDPRLNPMRDILYCEHSVQEQERLLAMYEYQLWCLNNAVAYRRVDVAQRQALYWLASK